MTMISYADVFELEDNAVHDGEIGIGDIVRMGANASPLFAVIAISGDKAWVRNAQNGQDALAVLQRCRKVRSGG